MAIELYFSFAQFVDGDALTWSRGADWTTGEVYEASLSAELINVVGGSFVYSIESADGWKGSVSAGDFGTSNVGNLSLRVGSARSEIQNAGQGTFSADNGAQADFEVTKGATSEFESYGSDLRGNWNSGGHFTGADSSFAVACEGGYEWAKVDISDTYGLKISGDVSNGRTGNVYNLNVGNCAFSGSAAAGNDGTLSCLLGVDVRFTGVGTCGRGGQLDGRIVTDMKISGRWNVSGNWDSSLWKMPGGPDDCVGLLQNLRTLTAANAVLNFRGRNINGASDS